MPSRSHISALAAVIARRRHPLGDKMLRIPELPDPTI